MVLNLLGVAFEFSDEYVVVSGRLVTGWVVLSSVFAGKGLTDLSNSRGPGAAFPFALKLVELLCGEENRKETADPLMLPPGLSI